MYDLLVIGGGPGGATCARRAAMKGLDVVLIEKRVHPRPKVCGGALSPRVNEFLDFDYSKLVQREFDAAAIHRPSGKISFLTREGFKGQLVEREQFDELLIKKAREAGVNVVEGIEIIGIEQLRKGIRALSVGDSFKGHLLVGADGVNGNSMKLLGIRQKWAHDNVSLCIQAEVPLDKDEIERITAPGENAEFHPINLYYGLTEWGYGWCFPKKKSMNIGIGCRLDKAKSLREKWTVFSAMISKQYGIDLRIERQSSARLPLGGTKQRYIGRRSMLVGDAAGLVSPVSGEGISYAIESGIHAAEVAVESVKQKTPTHIIEYDRRVKQSIERELNDLRFIAKIIYKSNANVDLICTIADEDPLVREYLMDFITRASTFSEPRSKIVKQLITRHPVKAIRLGL